MILAAVASLTLPSMADTLNVDSFRLYGPYPLQTPLMVDSVDVNGKKFAESMLSAAPQRLALTGESTPFTSGDKITVNGKPELGILTFSFETKTYATPKVTVDGLKDYTVYIDGEKSTNRSASLRPGTHNVAIRYIASEQPESISATVSSDSDCGLTLRTDGKRRYTLDDVINGTRITGVNMSPDGKYVIVSEQTTGRGGNGTRTSKVISTADGHTVLTTGDRLDWMPNGSRYQVNRATVDGIDLVAVDATTGAEEVLALSLPASTYFTVTPDEKYLIIHTSETGRTEDPKVYEILEPEDRQPGFRNRSGLSIYEIATGVTRPLSFGHHNTYLNDISKDGKLLICTSRTRLEKRPTTVFSLYQLDPATMAVDTLITDDGFFGNAIYSPDGKSILITGSPEALNGIGKNVPEGRIPNMTENELFIMDLATRNIRPVTKDFNPSISRANWSAADGMIYFNAENKDRISMYRMDPKTGKIEQLPFDVDNVGSFSVADNGRTIAWFGESVSDPQALYLTDSKTLKSRRLETPRAGQLADVKLGTCDEWNFVNSVGDTITGRFFLPPDFDPNKKYPLIVNYYGGCSPTSRAFEGRYPHNAYAAQGYVVYVVQPSGATGFGQEFASRHVNTAGEGVARDIIEGTKKFCEEHPYIDASKIGCIGASYGGFMTQYLQTVTDIFAAAISHAGISDHTSYWGEGYWGYSYSETSMAESYPWTRKDLYVDHSPLYNADKIHTPLLFLHGDKDNNVPWGESIQMFTALKLLGRPTAFVAVADQDHHILDYEKRIKWQDTIFAWFARYLKDDPSWWEALYPTTPL